MWRPGLAALAVSSLVVLVACGDGGTAACGPVERPELQGGGHLIGDAEPPVPYSSTPGTSGFHAAGAPPEGVFDEPLSEPRIVRSLESGQVVAAYDPERLAEQDVEELRELATGALSGQLTVTPFHGDMGAAVTLNAWGTRRPCSSVDAEVVRSFVEDFGGAGPAHE